MVHPQLVQFIKDNLKKGYSYQQIRGYLLANQWPSYLVDEAINWVYQESVQQQYQARKPHVALSKNVIIASAFISVVLVSLFIVFSLFWSSPSPVSANDKSDVAYSLTISEEKIPLEGTITLSNMITGVEAHYRVFPTFIISNHQTNNPVMRWTEESGIMSGDVITKELTASLKTGSYSIVSSFSYKGSVISAQDTFIVFEESETPTCSDGEKNQGESGVDCGGPCAPCASCSDNKKNQGESGVDCGGPCVPCDRQCKDCNDFNLCTEDICDEGSCMNEPIFPCCGNFICESDEDEENCPADCQVLPDKPVEFMSRDEILDKVREILKESQKQAGDFCDTVPDVKERDECFRILAYDADNKIFCNYVNSTVKRDACYMEFAMKYDYTVCPQIENVYLKKSCEALKKRPQPNTEVG